MCDNDRYFHFHLLKESQVAFSPYYRVAFFKKRKEIKFYLLYYCSRLLLYSRWMQLQSITFRLCTHNYIPSCSFSVRLLFCFFLTTTTAKKLLLWVFKMTYQRGEKMQSNNVASVSSFFDMIYPLNIIIVSNIIMYLFEVYGKDHLFCCNNDQPKTIFAFISIVKSGANQHWYIFLLFLKVLTFGSSN